MVRAERLLFGEEAMLKGVSGSNSELIVPLEHLFEKVKAVQGKSFELVGVEIDNLILNSFFNKFGFYFFLPKQKLIKQNPQTIDIT